MRAADRVIGGVGGNLGPAPEGPSMSAPWIVRVPAFATRPSYLMAERGEARIAIPWHAVLELRMAPAGDVSSSAPLAHDVIDTGASPPRHEHPVVLVAHGLKRGYCALERLIWRMAATPCPLPPNAPDGATEAVATDDGEVFVLASPERLLAHIDTPSFQAHPVFDAAPRVPTLTRSNVVPLPAATAVAEPAVEAPPHRPPHYPRPRARPKSWSPRTRSPHGCSWSGCSSSRGSSSPRSRRRRSSCGGWASGRGRSCSPTSSCRTRRASTGCAPCTEAAPRWLRRRASSRSSVTAPIWTSRARGGHRHAAQAVRSRAARRAARARRHPGDAMSTRLDLVRRPVTPCKVLVVDDDRRVRELLEIALTSNGFGVISAADGEEGLLRAQRERPDLVLLDVRLPKRSGLEVCDVLRNDPLDPSIPIILISALAESDHRLQGFLRGADDYLAKPFSPKELVARVRRLLARATETRNAVRRALELEREIASVKREARRAGEDARREESLRDVADTAGRDLLALLDLDALVERLLGLVHVPLRAATTAVLVRDRAGTHLVARAIRGDGFERIASLRLEAMAPWVPCSPASAGPCCAPISSGCATSTASWRRSSSGTGI
jgi:CheY-like chemotaxis protein